MKSLFYLLLSCCVLSACGFHLRELETSLPFSSLTVIGDSDAARSLRYSLRERSGVKVLDSGGQVVIAVESEDFDKSILALTGAGKVAEYLLHYRVRYSVHDAAGHVLVEPTLFGQIGDLPYNDQTSLASESEQTRLLQYLRGQAIDAILRRVATLKPPVEEDEHAVKP